MKEDKLSLIDQILFGDGSYELTLGDAEVDFTTAEWCSLDLDVKSQLEVDGGEEIQQANRPSLASTELLLKELESDRQLSSILSLDFLRSRDGQEDHKAAPGESSSPLDSSLLDDLLSTSGDCGDDSLDFAL